MASTKDKARGTKPLPQGANQAIAAKRANEAIAGFAQRIIPLRRTMDVWAY